MGKVRRLYWTILWVAVIVQIAMSTSAANTDTTTETPTQVINDTSITGYAWSAWGRWSRCSRTCGGGVSYQERQCLPRIPSNESTVEVTVRVTRQTHDHDCLGEARRYRECNVEPCVSNTRSMRAEQCAMYDRKPFRGRFYTWVPYIDGDHPCLLNCRPLGQQFYASLSIVADGTPCTRPGVRAMCVGGVCKVIGREAILAGSPARELHCGRRLVSGLFSRPRLPLGYSYVTTVPRGACRLNVSEIVPTENYIALKIMNGSFIMNGEFAVSSPGTYEAAGARFLYTRAGGLDQVFAVGPILEPIDIMILYTQPKPNIKYQYFTESSNDDTVDESNQDIPEIPPTSPTKHTRRHHNFPDTHRSSVSRNTDLVSMSKELEDNVNENVVGERKFMWKIVSYSQCTRTCGGGIQVGKHRCVESSATAPDREVSSAHCPGPAPRGRRRRCGVAPCPPRWRAAAWSQCPQCGPASRKRIVGCVQDHSRGITKISDQKCPPNRPHTIEKCNIPNCDEENINSVRRIESKRVKPRDHIDSFQEGPVYTVTVNNSDIDIGPEYSFSATAGWLFTEWSQCVGWCIGEGIQSRGVRCADPAGCAPRAPDSSRSCTPRIDCEAQQGEWFVGEWSPCSSQCNGKQVRGVLCVSRGGRRLKDSSCRTPKPKPEKECATECPPTWYFSDWGKCTGNCTEPDAAVERRSVVCSRGAGGDGVSDAECSEPRPRDHRSCDLQCLDSDVLPSTLSIQSQRGPEYEIVATTTMTTTTTSQKAFTKSPRLPKDCIDRLSNCQLVVQARLCNYNFYITNCCDSCIGR